MQAKTSTDTEAVAGSGTSAAADNKEHLKPVKVE
jgi:hypothetical protein